MTNQNEGLGERVRRALGSSRVVPLGIRPSQGPLDLLQLRAHVQERFQSSGGRPTDPSWELARTVRFGEHNWKQLEKLAKSLSSEGRKLAPGQLAAILVEHALAGIMTAEKRTALKIHLAGPPIVLHAASLRPKKLAVLTKRKPDA